MTADLDGLPFAIVRRGFDRAQVEERLSKLLSERDSAHTARQTAVADRERISRELDVSRGETRAARSELSETRAEVDRLAGQVAELSTIPNTVDGMSDRLQQMVRVAQDEVNDMRARATRGAAQILSMAQAEADELRDSARQERRTFEAEQRSAQDELHARLDETRTQLAALREEADGQRARTRCRARRAAGPGRADAGGRAGRPARGHARGPGLAGEAAARGGPAHRRRRVQPRPGAGGRRRRRHRPRALPAREQVVRANEELEQLRACSTRSPSSSPACGACWTGRCRGSTRRRPGGRRGTAASRRRAPSRRCPVPLWPRTPAARRRSRWPPRRRSRRCRRAPCSTTATACTVRRGRAADFAGRARLPGDEHGVRRGGTTRGVRQGRREGSTGPVGPDAVVRDAADQPDAEREPDPAGGPDPAAARGRPGRDLRRPSPVARSSHRAGARR